MSWLSISPLRLQSNRLLLLAKCGRRICRNGAGRLSATRRREGRDTTQANCKIVDSCFSTAVRTPDVVVPVPRRSDELLSTKNGREIVRIELQLRLWPGNMCPGTFCGRSVGTAVERRARKLAFGRILPALAGVMHAHSSANRTAIIYSTRAAPIRATKRFETSKQGVRQSKIITHEVLSSLENQQSQTPYENCLFYGIEPQEHNAMVLASSAGASLT